MKSSKIFFKLFLVVLSSVFVLAGCGGSKSSGEQSAGSKGGGNSASGGSTKNVLLWGIQTGNEQKLAKKITSQFNSKHKNIHAKIEFFQNDPYKKKLQVAMGANKAPDIFYNWGGGILKSYVDAGYVMDLTKKINSDPQWKNKYLPFVMQAVTFDGKIYGVPNNKVEPVVFNYNKKIFKKYGLKPPKTWSELLNVVKKLKSHNVIPISLAGKSAWTELMYEEYLVDRIGGPQVFNNVLKGKANAWSDPAFIKANKMIQHLADLGAFESGFSSVGFAGGAADALVYTDKAAMQLMGSWDFANILSSKPSYIKNGYFGWFPFPKVKGGSGNPNDVAGNLSNYYSITQDAQNKDAAVQYLKDAVLNETEIKGVIANGGVPPVKGIQDDLKKSKHADWQTFLYQLAKNAPHYQLSWDQALPPKEATEMLDDLSKLFLKEMTPKQFSKDMNQYLKK